MPIRTLNPTTGQIVRTFEEDPPAAIEAKLAQAVVALAAWREASFARRGEILRNAAAILRREARDLAILMAIEMGKPVTQGIAEAEKCAWACEYYAEHAEAMLAPRRVATDAAESFVRFDPLGAILAVMPWNFPLWQVFRFAAPALMAGNVGLLKHASNVLQCALVIERILRDAGLPEGVFQTLLVGSEAVPALIADPRIAAVTLTGSEVAGRHVAQAAGRAIKKTVLELGGSDPFVVLADADLAAAARTAAQARLVNSGQSCIAAKRFIAVRPVVREFEERLRAALATAVVGDPLDERTQVGPLARQDLRRDLHDQVESSLALGARLLLGGAIPDGPGFFYPVTLLADVRPGMAVFDEETFGPVAALTVAEDENEAIALANRTTFGLGASLWTRDLGRAQAIAARIEAGSVFVNGQVKSDPRLPFGGVKRSGYGRELGEEGIREFVNAKTVWIGG